MREYSKYIYDRYLSGHGLSAAVPASISDLKPRSAYLTGLIQNHFPPDKHAVILDLGCGHGALLHFAKRKGYTNIRGIDLSQEQIETAWRLGIQDVNKADMLREVQSLKHNSHDMIITFDVIEHYSKNEVVEFVHEIHRVLRPGGIRLIHTPNGESPFGGRVFYGDFTHETAFTRVSIAQLLQTAGFSKVSSYEDTPVIHGMKSFVRWLLWKVIRAALRLYSAAETGDTGNNAIFTQNFLTVAVK